MSAEKWFRAYNDAWQSFYSKENMIKTLSRWNHNPRNYWNLISIFFWYKNAAVIEREHPMIAGFFRLKDRAIAQALPSPNAPAPGLNSFLSRFFPSEIKKRRIVARVNFT